MRLNLFFSCTLFLLLFSVIEAKPSSKLTPHEANFTILKKIPIQQGGRLKPLDTFAREAVQTVTGKTKFHDMEAIEVIFSWMFYPNTWNETPVIEITREELKTKLGLNVKQKYFSLEEIYRLQGLQKLFQEVHEKQEREEKLSRLEENIERLSTQITVLERMSSGDLLTIIPHSKGAIENWFSLAQLSDLNQFREVYPEEKSQDLLKQVQAQFASLGNAYDKNEKDTFFTLTKDIEAKLSQLPSKPNYPFVTSLNTEVFYNDFHPFRKAWIFYVLSFLAFLLYFALAKNKILATLGFSTSLVAFLLHSFGFYLRCTITGHPPVGNMYESVVWVSLGTVFFAYLLLYQYRNFVIITVACAISSIGLILADNLPLVLDPSIKPLTPVLRSNYWLTIHVLTITLSYAAFALAMGLGNWALLKILTHPEKKESIRSISQFIYRCIQMGVLLLAAGTILGGIWADYSWGRFWGWDPKEVWALIALLLYLAVVHGKFAGWLKDFGLAVCSVIAFQGVLMAWYGVNFVLGVGLHSYGFGSGGLPYVLVYVALQIFFIFASWYRLQNSSV